MAKRKSTKSRAIELNKKISSNYWWDLSHFEKFVRNEFEYLIAQRILNEPEAMSLEEYNSYLETEQAEMHAQSDMEECEIERVVLSTFLSEEKIAEANKLAAFIFEKI